MKHVYIVTEGSLDAVILKKLLPADLIQATQFVVAEDSYSARSLSSTILATRQVPTAMVVNGETEDASAAREQRELLRFILRQASAGIPCEVFVATPEVAVVLFADKMLLEALFQIPLSDVAWEQERHHPGKFLREALSSHSLTIEQLLDRLTDPQLAFLRDHPLIKEITQFLSSQIYGAKLA